MTEKQRKKARLDYGGIFVEIGKLVFAGVVLSGIINGKSDQIPLIIVATVVAIVFIIFGEYLILKNEE